MKSFLCTGSMKYIQKLNFGVIVCFWSLFLLSQTIHSQTKNEMRGVWMATLLNIDWPSSANLTTQQQKQEIITILNHHQSVGINALFLQIRPAADAFYRSSYEPWSKWLTGTQGQEPNPYYDPLSFWIKECHRRGMELHAWFNPFRAAVSEDADLLSNHHIVHERPDWFINYGSRIYFNPGLPSVRDYVTKVIMEVVNNYDMDGVHFDDYFYPYKIEGQEFSDHGTFQKLGEAFSNIGDWRRDNVSSFIKNISDSIRSVKPEVRFGISPSGVWRNKDMDVTGSDTRAGQTAFDDLYADVLLWMKSGWVDYLAPQIYWHIGFELADYQVLLEWWSKHSYGRHIYIGQSAYKIRKDADFTAWRNPQELPRHLRLNHKYPQVKGNIFFSSKSLRANALGIGDSLKNNYFQYPALVPPMFYKPVITLKTPYLYRISHGHKMLTIYWSGEEKQKKQSRYQLVYRYKGDKNPGQENPKYIIALLPPETRSFEDTPPKKGYYTYVVSSVSITNHESLGSHELTINYRKRKPRKKKIKT